jgi:hypothetical protein
MNTALVATVVDEPMDFTVLATSPSEMEAGQRSLILWAARKIQNIKIELTDAQYQLQECVTKKWNTAGWRGQVLKLEKRLSFYRKIKAALEAGYYIVPPFPVDVFAIRTNKMTPRDGQRRTATITTNCRSCFLLARGATSIRNQRATRIPNPKAGL